MHSSYYKFLLLYQDKESSVKIVMVFLFFLIGDKFKQL